MSRIGKQPIEIPAGVTVTVQRNLVTVSGTKGELKREIHPDITVEVHAHSVAFSPKRETKKTSALWGLSRTLVANMVEGMARGFEKKLEIEGIGYRVSQDGDSLVFQLGFSHPVRFKAPEGVSLKAEKNTITVSGIDKEAVGATAARIRSLKPPEPYKGKGIHYQGEVIRRKAGKKAVASA